MNCLFQGIHCLFLLLLALVYADFNCVQVTENKQKQYQRNQDLFQSFDHSVDLNKVKQTIEKNKLMVVLR